MPSPCSGLRVVDITQGMAGGLATMVLADAGADVVKVEPPRGDWAREHPAWIMWNRGKRSVVLDLKTPNGLRDLRELVSSADILLSGWSAAEATALGIDYGVLREQNPALVTCALTGFGPLKGYEHLKGYEGVVSAKTGRMHAFDGQIDKDGPIYAALNCASYGAAMYAIQGVMGAIHVRRQTGTGQHIGTSLLQSLTAYDWGWLVWQVQQRPGYQPFVMGSPTPQYHVGRTKDGRWIQSANGMSHLIINFVIGIGASEILDEPRYAGLPNIAPGKDMEELYELWQERMLERSAAEWMEVFTNEFDVGAEPLLTSQEALSHPQVVHNGNVIDLHDPAVGKTRQLGPLVNFAETPMVPQGPAPSLGQHTEEVMGSLVKRKPLVAKKTTPGPRYPLEGLVVLEFATWFAGPYGPAILADMGARVIKVESLEGDPWRQWGPMGVRTVQGKESVAVNLKTDEGQAIVRELIKKADVLMHNNRPSAAERMGIAYEQIKDINPRLIYLYAGAYGSSGPSAHRPAFHPIPGAICGGVLYQGGRAMPPPAEQEMSYPELRAASSSLFRANEGNPDVTSALGVAAAILMAINARDETGRGQYLETTMLCSTLYSNADDCVSYEGKPDRQLPDDDLNGLHALYRFYRAKEGWVFLAAPLQKEWEALCDVLKQPDLKSDVRFGTSQARMAADKELVKILSELLKGRTALEWEVILSAVGVGCAEARATGFNDFANNDQAMKDAGMWVATESPDYAEYWRYGAGVTFESEPCLKPVGTVGDHTVSVLHELGYDQAALNDMRERKVITWPGND
ncbi:CoA transferase [Dehalococcoidia bacterium]|nr:CoA transferase [Dehalococcoidia bacterium]